MTDRESRERLVELIRQAKTKITFFTSDGEPVTQTERLIVDRAEVGELADHLLANGVVVQKQGVWKDNNNGTFTCSVCGGRASKMSYCGNCGAKMKEREGK